tara:strand:- start:1815 stop:2312 length:498 start_codon:yes stop_codon:yes gene_type:complete
MHVVSWTYPDHGNDESRKRAYDFIHALAHVIPCMRCRVDWVHYLSKHFDRIDTPHLDSREAFTKFVVDGHNAVNRKLNKREYTYEDARQLYDPNAPEPSASLSTLRMLGIFVLCAAVVITYATALRLLPPRATCPDAASSGRVDRGSDLRVKNSEIFAAHRRPSA